jgi:hypothetical protein
LNSSGTTSTSAASFHFSHVPLPSGEPDAPEPVRLHGTQVAQYLSEWNDLPPVTICRCNELPPNELAFINSLVKGLTPQQQASLPTIPQGGEASACTQAKGVIAGGAGAYAVSFLPAKEWFNVVSLWDPELAAALFPFIAGTLSAVFGEPIAGAVRTGYGTYPSPDAVAWANYVTASARMVSARCSGNLTQYEQCKADRDTVVKSVVDREEAESEKNTPLLAIKGHPMISALLRSIGSDELPFLCFAVTYLVSGAASPYERAELGDSDLLDRFMFLLVEFLTSVGCGLAGGVGTALFQNLLRPALQHAPKPREGIHSRVVSDALRAREAARVEMLNANRDKLLEIAESVRAQTGKEPDLQAQKDMIERALKKNRKTRERLGSISGRNSISSENTLAATVLGKPKASPAFLNGSPLQRRTGAKALANSAALLLWVPYATFLSILASLKLPFDRLGPHDGRANRYFNSTQDQAAYVARGTADMEEYSIESGIWLILCWLTRSIWLPPLELSFGAIHGLGVAAVSRCRRSHGVVAVHTAVPTDDGPAAFAGRDDGLENDVEEIKRPGVVHVHQTI